MYNLLNSLPAARIVSTLFQVIELRRNPEKIRTDNGQEFIGSKFKLWCKEIVLELQYPQPGKSIQNGRAEQINRTC